MYLSSVHVSTPELSRKYHRLVPCSCPGSTYCLYPALVSAASAVLPCSVAAAWATQPLDILSGGGTEPHSASSAAVTVWPTSDERRAASCTSPSSWRQVRSGQVRSGQVIPSSSRLLYHSQQLATDQVRSGHTLVQPPPVPLAAASDRSGQVRS